MRHTHIPMEALVTSTTLLPAVGQYTIINLIFSKNSQLTPELTPNLNPIDRKAPNLA
jgi:hypothetical protein